MAKKKAQSKKVGRPLIKLDYDALKAMCKIHCTVEEICDIFGISYSTLNLRMKQDGHGSFQRYYKKHSTEGQMSLRRVQMKKAIEDENVTMLIWLGKQLLGQKDRIENDISGETKPQVTINVNPSVDKN